MRRHRRSVVVTSTALLMTGLLAAPLAEAATPADTGGEPDHRATSAAAADRLGSQAEVTLLTGHTVRILRTPDGRQSAIVTDTPDGSSASVLTFTDGTGDLHVVPRDALPYLLDGRLDQRLFDVTSLIEQDYDDADRAGIPLIVSYPDRLGAARVTAQAGTLRTAGAARVRAFDNAGAVAATVTKARAGAFWKAMTGRATTPDLLGPARRIWLDGPVEATLDESVPLVGAPQAWSEGYDGSGVTVAVLDSGYDAAHPDLAGRVVGAESFDGTGSAADGNGHGTHVAATVAGSGAASDGLRKGVAPGADLLIGKVLDDNGFGQESWVLAGMEWAADSGADVVNMSLGGNPTGGTDPLSAAVNDLTAATDTLFVIAAGNSGPYSGTIGTPGAADDALTVGNTDKSDQVNRTSSRGPRLGDHAVKPELTAPGTAIVAARAAGTSLGSPVDELYTSLTGTSMATPHVAGAAAILAQRHPDWTAEQLKSALVGSAHPLPDGTVFDRGAGRLDVPAALHADVLSEPSTLSFGFQPWPNDGLEPIERTVGYRNSGDAPVTLDLSVTATHSAGSAVPDGAVSVTPASLTIPAGGTASAVVTVVPDLVETGDLGGIVEASTGDSTVRTPWSYAEENERYDLTIDAIGRDGERSTGWAMVWSERMGRFYWGVWLDGTGPQTLRLPKDDYMVIGGSTVYDADGAIAEETVDGTPELVLTEDRTVTLDAREGDEIAFDTPRPSTPTSVKLGWTRWYDDSGWMDGWLQYSGDLPRLAVAPSEPVERGEFEFVAGGRSVAPGAPEGRTPYLYDLLIPTPDRLPADGTYEVERADLARIDSTFVGVGEGGRTTVESRTGFSALGATSIGARAPVLEAGPRADYVSAGGVQWHSSVRLPRPGDLRVPTMWDNPRSYPAGGRLSTRWWGAPYSVGTDSTYSVTDAYRDEDRLSILVRDYQDGEPGHWGDSYFRDDEISTVRGRLYLGDTLLRDGIGGSFSVSGLPAEESTYRYVHSITRRGPVWSSSSYSESDWTFRSGYQEVTDWPPQGIPLLDVNWTVPTDAQNRAPDRSPFWIGLQARHVRGLDGGPIGRARVWVSYDDGDHWRRVVLLPRDDDRYRGLIVHPPKWRTSGWVSLRAKVTDGSGGSLTQTAIRAYALR